MLTRTSDPATGSEYELVLMVKSENPEQVLNRILETKTIADYRLIPEQTKKIHDVYFDARDQSLSRHRLNLRLRGVEKQWRVTLKKSPGLFTRNRNRREEIELEWSPASWDRIRAELSRHGVDLKRTKPEAVSEEIDPTQALMEDGLGIIQDRETLRRSIRIVSQEGEVLAELAVDTVTYRFTSGNVRLNELEIEAKSEMRSAVLRQMSDAFVRTFAPDLVRWRMGKLRTGARIEKLVKNGRLKGLMNGEGKLRPEAYDLIAKG